MKMEQKLQKDAERINVIASKFKAIKKTKRRRIQAKKARCRATKRTKTNREGVSIMSKSIDQQIKEIQSNLTKLKKQIDNDEFYFIDSFFDVRDSKLLSYEFCDGLSDTENHFENEHEAAACAKFLREKFWFIRKAIKFSNGYKFNPIKNNYFVYYSDKEWGFACNTCVDSCDIYMSESNAAKFCEWLNKNKPYGWE